MYLYGVHFSYQIRDRVQFLEFLPFETLHMAKTGLYEELNSSKSYFRSILNFKYTMQRYWIFEGTY